MSGQQVALLSSTWFSEPSGKYKIRSKFLRHCVFYNIVELTDLQAEILEATGFDIHYMCKSLSSDSGIQELRLATKYIYKNLHFKNPDVAEQNFKFASRTKRRYKTIGMYASENSSEYFSNMDNNGRIQPSTLTKQAK